VELAGGRECNGGHGLFDVGTAKIVLPTLPVAVLLLLNLHLLNYPDDLIQAVDLV
jgi:hypothetical protein